MTKTADATNRLVRVGDTTVVTLLHGALTHVLHKILVILGPYTPVVTGDMLVRLFVVLLFRIVLWDGQEDQPGRGVC